MTSFVSCRGLDMRITRPDFAITAMKISPAAGIFPVASPQRFASAAVSCCRSCPAEASRSWPASPGSEGSVMTADFRSRSPARISRSSMTKQPRVCRRQSGRQGKRETRAAASLNVSLPASPEDSARPSSTASKAGLPRCCSPYRRSRLSSSAPALPRQACAAARTTTPSA